MIRCLWFLVAYFTSVSEILLLIYKTAKQNMPQLLHIHFWPVMISRLEFDRLFQTLPPKVETSFTRGGTQVVKEGKASDQNGKMGISEGDSPHLKGSCFFFFLRWVIWEFLGVPLRLTVPTKNIYRHITHEVQLSNMCMKRVYFVQSFGVQCVVKCWLKVSSLPNVFLFWSKDLAKVEYRNARLLRARQALRWLESGEGNELFIKDSWSCEKGEFWSLKYSEDQYEVRWPQKHKYHFSFVKISILHQYFYVYAKKNIYMFLKFLPIMNLMFILQTILFHTCSHLCLTNDLNTRFFGWFIWSI